MQAHSGRRGRRPIDLDQFHGSVTPPATSCHSVVRKGVRRSWSRSNWTGVPQPTLAPTLRRPRARASKRAACRRVPFHL